MYRKVGYICSYLFVVLIFIAISLVALGVYQSGGRITDVSLNEIRIALILASTFMVLSGYPIGFIMLFIFYTYSVSSMMRSLINSALLLVHSAVFAFVAGEQPISLSVSDLPYLAIGFASVIAAELTTNAGNRRLTKAAAV